MKGGRGFRRGLVPLQGHLISSGGWQPISCVGGLGWVVVSRRAQPCGSDADRSQTFDATSLDPATKSLALAS
jgi:hypothetical protein